MTKNSETGGFPDNWEQLRDLDGDADPVPPANVALLLATAPESGALTGVIGTPPVPSAPAPVSDEETARAAERALKLERLRASAMRVPLQRSWRGRFSLAWHRLHGSDRFCVCLYVLWLLMLGGAITFREPLGVGLVAPIVVWIIIMVTTFIAQMTDTYGERRNANQRRLAQEDAVIGQALLMWLERFREHEDGSQRTRNTRVLYLKAIRYYSGLLCNDRLPTEVKNFLEEVGEKGTPVQPVLGGTVTHEESPLYKP